MFGIWPENVDSLTAFAAAATQWRHVLVPPTPGAAGRMIRTGLDHAGLAATIGAFKRPSKRLRSVFEDCLAMEDAALAAFAEADR